MNEDNITNFITSLSLEIRKERKKLNILTKDAAKAINLNSSSYSNLENNPLKSTALLKFCFMVNTLNISLSSILKTVYTKQYNIDSNFTEYNKYEKLDEELLINQVFIEMKNERVSQKISQRVLAEKVGIHKRYISQIENGNRKHISLYKLLEISEALKVPIYKIVERAEQFLLAEDKD